MMHEQRFQFGLFHFLILLLVFLAGGICGGMIVKAKSYTSGYRQGLFDESRWPGIDRRWTPIHP